VPSSEPHLGRRADQGPDPHRHHTYRGGATVPTTNGSNGRVSASGRHRAVPAQVPIPQPRAPRPGESVPPARHTVPATTRGSRPPRPDLLLPLAAAVAAASVCLGVRLALPTVHPLHHPMPRHPLRY
jgi:hypothetical protein